MSKPKRLTYKKAAKRWPQIPHEMATERIYGYNQALDDMHDHKANKIKPSKREIVTMITKLHNELTILKGFLKL